MFSCYPCILKKKKKNLFNLLTVLPNILEILYMNASCVYDGLQSFCCSTNMLILPYNLYHWSGWVTVVVQIRAFSWKFVLGSHLHFCYSFLHCNFSLDWWVWFIRSGFIPNLDNGNQPYTPHFILPNCGPLQWLYLSFMGSCKNIADSVNKGLRNAH